MKSCCCCAVLLFGLGLSIQAAERARDLAIPLEGTLGAWNAITDVAGVEVGYQTLISGEGQTAVRTGVTAVWPRGKNASAPVFGGWFSLNGNGEMTSTTWLEKSGLLSGPVLITNTHSVGTVRDAFIKWQVARARKSGRAESGLCPWWRKPGMGS
jgi:D-aminopeptidase